MADDTGTNDGGTDGQRSGFSQEQVDAFVAAERRKGKETADGLAKSLDEAKGLVAQSDTKLKEMETNLNSSKREAAKFKVGLEAGLPLAIAERLTGDDEDALKADAEKLSELLKWPDEPKPPRLEGPKGGAPETQADMNDLIRRKAGRGTS
jgi:hypothetical protein